MAPGRKFRLNGLIAGLILLACACAPEPTPLPVILPTLPPATAAPAADATDAPLRYALAPDALPYLSAADRAAISAHAGIIALDSPPDPADLGSAYDLIVSLAALPDASLSPTELQISLLIDTSLVPLDDPQLADLLRLAIDPQAVARALGISSEQAGASPTLTTAALRADLANAGYPDGFDVALAADGLPGAGTIAQMLAAVGIDARAVTAQPAHLTLTSAAPPDASAALPIYRLPIHFLAVDGLSITFTPSGFPIPQRSE